MNSRFFAALLLSGIAATACASTDDDAVTGDDDLTSITARSRKLQFEGKVFVGANASDSDIAYAAQKQAQTAFGPFRTNGIAVNSRELRNIDPSTFKKRKVKQIDTSVANDPGKDMLEVRYTYSDDAVVDAKYARRTAVSLAVMNPSYQQQAARITRECTANDSEAAEFQSSIWYVFEPTVASCGPAMKAEQKQVDADRAKLSNRTTQVTKSEVDQLYIPISVKLGADKTNKGQSWPEYQRLYAGGVKSDKLVISLVYGLIDDAHANGWSGDYNWGELMTNLSVVFGDDDGWKIAPGPDGVDLAHFTLASGKKVDNASIKALVGAHDGGDALHLTYADAKDLDKQLADRMYRKWVVLERPLSVSIGGAPAKDFATQLLVYFGAQSDSTPHKYAIKNSDVFLYNGHSYIGFGPLDPSNFTAADFPTSYQLFWVDGCVSYNYYEKDYKPLKQGGTKNLDLVTNGIEAPSWQSGSAMGQFVATLLNGQHATYRDLLQSAEATDPLRVVDGELDNDFTPTKFPITITPR